MSPLLSCSSRSPTSPTDTPPSCEPKSERLRPPLPSRLIPVPAATRVQPRRSPFVATHPSLTAADPARPSRPLSCAPTFRATPPTAPPCNPPVSHPPKPSAAACPPCPSSPPRRPLLLPLLLAAALSSLAVRQTMTKTTTTTMRQSPTQTPTRCQLSPASSAVRHTINPPPTATAPATLAAPPLTTTTTRTRTQSPPSDSSSSINSPAARTSAPRYAATRARAAEPKANTHPRRRTAPKLQTRRPPARRRLPPDRPPCKAEVTGLGRSRARATRARFRLGGRRS